MGFLCRTIVFSCLSHVSSRFSHGFLRWCPWQASSVVKNHLTCSWFLPANAKARCFPGVPTGNAEKRKPKFCDSSRCARVAVGSHWGYANPWGCHELSGHGQMVVEQSLAADGFNCEAQRGGYPMRSRGRRGDSTSFYPLAHLRFTNLEGGDKTIKLGYNRSQESDEFNKCICI